MFLIRICKVCKKNESINDICSECEPELKIIPFPPEMYDSSIQKIMDEHIKNIKEQFNIKFLDIKEPKGDTTFFAWDKNKVDPKDKPHVENYSDNKEEGVVYTTYTAFDNTDPITLESITEIIGKHIQDSIQQKVFDQFVSLGRNENVIDLDKDDYVVKDK